MRYALGHKQWFIQDRLLKTEYEMGGWLVCEPVAE